MSHSKDQEELKFCSPLHLCYANEALDMTKPLHVVSVHIGG
jgi:hypothetical protein